MRNFESFLLYSKKPKTGHVEIVKGPMLIHTNIQNFDIKKIKNRFFMYSPEAKELILNTEYRYSDSPENIALKVDCFDDHYGIRGYVGTGKIYKNGIIHFSPAIYIEGSNPPKAGIKEAIECIEMFIKNGATDEIVIKSFMPNTKFSNPTSEKDLEEGTWKQIKKNMTASRFDL